VGCKRITNCRSSQDLDVDTVEKQVTRRNWEAKGHRRGRGRQEQHHAGRSLYHADVFFRSILVHRKLRARAPGLGSASGCVYSFSRGADSICIVTCTATLVADFGAPIIVNTGMPCAGHRACRLPSL
jgi:hypothetical protein